jgi:putative membrane protein
MKTSYLTLSCLALVTIGFSSHALALDSSDKTFIKKAAEGGMTEVDAGKMAQEKGSTQDVKDFGAMMVKDHTQNDEDLTALAKTKGVETPMALDSMHQKMVDSLSSKSGAAFDSAYINMMVKAHTKMLAMMKSEESSSDADLKDFATKTSDTVQMHLSKAQDLQKSMMAK